MNLRSNQREDAFLDALLQDFPILPTVSVAEREEAKREQEARTAAARRRRELEAAGLDPFSVAMRKLASRCRRVAPKAADLDSFVNFREAQAADGFVNESTGNRVPRTASDEALMRALDAKERCFINDLLERFHSSASSGVAHREAGPSALLRAKTTRTQICKNRPLPTRTLKAGPWERVSDKMKVIYTGEALAVDGSAYDVTGQLTDTIKAKALAQANPCSWLAKRINRHLESAFEQAFPHRQVSTPEMVLVPEIGEGEIGLHLHGIISVPQAHRQLALKAMREPSAAIPTTPEITAGPSAGGRWIGLG